MIISILKELSDKKEFNYNLIDLIFIKASNKKEFKNSKYVKIDNKSTPQNAFKNCSSIEYVILSNKIECINMGSFCDCINLRQIIL